MYKLALLCSLTHCRSIDRIFPYKGDASHTTDIKLRRLLNFKTRVVTECDLIPLPAPGQKQAIEKTKCKFEIERFTKVVTSTICVSIT